MDSVTREKIDEILKYSELLTSAGLSIGIPAVVLFSKFAANHAQGRKVTTEELELSANEAHEAVAAIPGDQIQEE